MPKIRLDQYLVEKKLAPTREKAQAVIMEGKVFVDNQKTTKSGTFVSEGQTVELRGNVSPYVSRGGLKLEKAIDTFKIDVKGKIAMDIGASTGGFTDCILQNGARQVYCVDVGYGQLAWKIRQDERVVCMERTNIRYIDKNKLPLINFICIDVSFISLKLVFPVAFDLLDANGACVALIKPQFEAGKGKIGKNGIVRDKNIHIEVIQNVLNFAAECGFMINGLTFSPIRGAQGNIEYLVCLKKNGEGGIICIGDVVENAHNCYNSQ
ncbi:MAG: TlyA family RNA methyltransferase [Clostridiales bacterium]|jgi:23S rRNA (cytidine1920-2'-O)/16S rRNA (cytidine1409-2'-O)-methyltransferase|nr:TlyA family RNA methyltransferase [Clostridiales bacterium]